MFVSGEISRGMPANKNTMADGCWSWYFSRYSCNAWDGKLESQKKWNVFLVQHLIFNNVHRIHSQTLFQNKNRVYPIYIYNLYIYINIMCLNMGVYCTSLYPHLLSSLPSITCVNKCKSLPKKIKK